MISRPSRVKNILFVVPALGSIFFSFSFTDDKDETVVILVSLVVFWFAWGLFFFTAVLFVSTVLLVSFLIFLEERGFSVDGVSFKSLILSDSSSTRSSFSPIRLSGWFLSTELFVSFSTSLGGRGVSVDGVSSKSLVLSESSSTTSSFSPIWISGWFLSTQF